jgi:lipid-A-disaccharide synthase
MRVFLSAGEASGDAYAAALIAEMRNVGGQALQFEGSGGPKMAAVGVQRVADTSRWGAISIVQALKVYPRIVRGYYRTKSALGKGTPGLFIPIDFGYVNIRLARHAKNRGWKVLYFVPPGSWRRDKQGKDLPTITDAIVTPFSWSAEILNEMGANAHWFGHPIKQLLRNSIAARPDVRDTVAVLPGSRKHEISENLPVIAQALAGPGKIAYQAGNTPIGSFEATQREIQPLEAPIEFALAPTVDVQRFRAEWQRLAPHRTGDRFTVGDTAAVLSRAKAAIVCSGTATLEAALCHCPMVVVYRVSKAVVLEAKLVGFKRPKYIALPNILLDRDTVPELLQDEAKPTLVRRQLEAVLREGEEREAQLSSFEELEGILGPDDAISQAARLALSMGR